ncbi:LolA family protein [Agromyces aerolatus]|uniref:LolA family protein n=1 Tax=Agromyces sp. LY-1074 TaxID=3074080 RepID=UPI0028658A65|nr:MULTISPECIES: hypothetical protein [unclassified Agromyces]MDR5701153.1 hypothetical protein [Agromyces sp. LY-1074]MDR5707793.1 hypothetical protein [Agromyces sp. LY-1358]
MSPRVSGPSRVRARVLVPAIGVPLVVAAAVFVPLQATAAVDLPDKTPQQLLEFAASSDVDALSGTVEQRTELGLPDLSAVTGGAGDSGGAGDEASAGTEASIDDLLALATGDWDARVYLDGDRARLQVLDRLAERNVYVSPDDAWFVDSETATATRLVLPSDDEVQRLHDDLEATFPGADERKADAAEQLPSPQQALDRALARLDETTEVSVGSDGRVAGRDAYELVLEPRTDETLVGELRFAIDGETGAPLSASITARGADEPAYSIGFSDVSFAAPEASALVFEPAADLTVVEKPLPLPTADELARWKAEAEAHAADPAAQPDGPAPVVHGEGWSAVVELTLPAEAPGAGATGADAPGAGDLLGPLAALGQPVAGGQALSTSLVSVLVTDDGRVFAGSVPVERLVELAGGGS